METITLKTPVTFTSNDDYVRVIIGNCYSWMPCVIRDEDLPRVRDWLNEQIVIRAAQDVFGV